MMGAPDHFEKLEQTLQNPKQTGLLSERGAVAPKLPNWPPTEVRGKGVHKRSSLGFRVEGSIRV